MVVKRKNPNKESPSYYNGQIKMNNGKNDNQNPADKQLVKDALSEPKPAPVPETMRRFDKNGYVDTILPNGTPYKGSETDASTIASFLKRREEEKQRQAKIILDTTQQFNDNQLKEKTINDLTPATVTQDQLNQVGQVDPLNTINSDLSAGIINNNQIRQNEADTLNYITNPTAFGNTQDLTTFGDPGFNKVGTKVIGAIPLGIGNKFLELFQNTKAGRDWIQDYSNENNYNAVKDRIVLAQDKLDAAIIYANKPGDIKASQDAIEGYNKALVVLRQSVSDLKRIEQGDQRKYVESVHDDRVKLETYLKDNVYAPGQLNDKFKAVLQKPNPSNFNQYITQNNQGGNVGGN